MRKRSRKRIGLTERVPLLLPETPNHAWSMDFVHDGLADGRRIRCLNVVDDCTKESIVIEVDTMWRVYWIALLDSGLYHG